MQAQEIKSYVRKVRANLNHLQEPEIRELTENLEADLIERLNDEGSNFTLPSPKAYASELIDAAELPNKNTEVSALALSFYRFWGKIARYFKALSPAWAIIRGYLLYAVGFGLLFFHGIHELPRSNYDAIILLGFIAVSVWLSIKQFTFLKYPLIFLNVILLLTGVVVSADIAQKVESYQFYKGFQNDPHFVLIEGKVYSKVCAYDKLGNLLQLDTLADTLGYKLFENPNNSVQTCQTHLGN